MFYELFNFIGETGPITLFILIIILLLKRKQSKLIMLFIIFQLFNNILNLLLKIVFKQPRPSNTYTYKSLFDANKYGMPSGHAQMITSELIFIIYYFNNLYINIFALFQTFITLTQRYYSNYHTFMQIAVGSLIGATITLLFLRNPWFLTSSL